MSIFEGEKESPCVYDKDDALKNIRALYAMWKRGLLGGEVMPEDSNPHLDDIEANLTYFTLPMALNYQRNSYKLWESALKTYVDEETSYLFQPIKVLDTNPHKVKEDLMKYKVALQPNKQTDIWRTLCRTIVQDLGGRLETLFKKNEYKVTKVLEEIQVNNKKKYPYLSGNKIANYWLYVLISYTPLKLSDKQNIAGKEIVSPKEKNITTVANLMDALTKSLELTKKQKTTKKGTKK